jgi:phosphate transport system substrate-binding protein
MLKTQESFDQMKRSFLLASVLFAGAAFAADQAAVKLVIKGSDTLGAKLVPMLAEAYKAKHSDVTFEIAAEGSSTGISAIIDSTAQIGMSSRPTKPEEDAKAAAKSVKMVSTTVVWDGVALIVNENNPLASLTKKQVEEIFTGDVADWSAVGGVAGTISIYTRNTSSGTYAEWKHMAMSKRDYAPAAQKMAGNEQIAAEVAKNPNGVGYVGLAYAKAAGVKVVSIDGVMPSNESVLSKKYPYARPTFYITNGEPTGVTAKFIEFTLSAEGQAIAEKIGFVPVK